MDVSDLAKPLWFDGDGSDEEDVKLGATEHTDNKQSSQNPFDDDDDGWGDSSDDAF